MKRSWVTQDEGAGKICQVLFKDFEGRDVEIVSGYVNVGIRPGVTAGLGSRRGSGL